MAYNKLRKLAGRLFPVPALDIHEQAGVATIPEPEPIDGDDGSKKCGRVLTDLSAIRAAMNLDNETLLFGQLPLMPDGSSLIVAESYAKRLTAFDIEADGGLSNRRVWADLGDGVPDSICADVENAVWYADVPNQRCVRVREGGEVLDTIQLDRGCFACALGGADRTTLFMLAQEWNGPENMFKEPRSGVILMTQAPAAGAGWP